MNIHRQLIGTSWIIFGALMISLLAMKLDSGKTLFIVAGLTAGLVYFAAGFTLLAKWRNAHWICLPCSALSILAFPVGTLIGIYYLWYYLKTRPPKAQ